MLICREITKSFYNAEDKQAKSFLGSPLNRLLKQQIVSLTQLHVPRYIALCVEY